MNASAATRPLSGRRALHILLFVISALLASACGPSVDLKPEFAQVKPRLVALLPAKADPDIREARVRYLDQSLAAAVESRGFLLVDPLTVARECGGVGCPNRKQLFEKYALQGVFEFSLSSVARNNFGLGFYNTITGTLRLVDRDGKELLKIDHTEREKGGVVFESGQVIQGIISQVRNSGDDSYNRLADRFARTLALRIPPPEGAGNEPPSDAEKVEVGQVTAKELKPNVYQICADASARAQTSLVIHKLRIPLRQSAPGHFCGIVPLYGSGGEESKIIVEARSAFGDATRREVPLILQPVCDLNGKIRVKGEPAKGYEVTVACHTASGGKGKAEMIECEVPQGKCAPQKFLVYRAQAEVGPYEKVAEVRTVTWFDRMKGFTASPRYYIVPVGADGRFSPTVAALGE